MLTSSIASLLLLAGSQPLLQAGAIVFGTFVLEDAATVIAAMQAGDHKLSIALALASLFVGIVLGDLGLYAAGGCPPGCRWLARLLPPHRQEADAELAGGPYLQGGVRQPVPARLCACRPTPPAASSAPT